MKFTVTWTDEARDTLCELFMAVPNPGEISRLVNAIERELGRNPLGVGESRDGSMRVVMRENIGILFEVSLADFLVQVLHIGWLP